MIQSQIWTEDIDVCTSSPENFSLHSSKIIGKVQQGNAMFWRVFFTRITSLITSRDVPIITRFYSLYLLFKCTAQVNVEFVSRLLEADELLTFIYNTSQYDWYRPSDDRGKDFFSKHPHKLEARVGVNFVRLCVESMLNWKQIYGSKPNPDFQIFNIYIDRITKKMKLSKHHRFIDRDYDLSQNLATWNFSNKRPDVLNKAADKEKSCNILQEEKPEPETEENLEDSKSDELDPDDRIILSRQSHQNTVSPQVSSEKQFKRVSTLFLGSLDPKFLDTASNPVKTVKKSDKLSPWETMKQLMKEKKEKEKEGMLRSLEIKNAVKNEPVLRKAATIILNQPSPKSTTVTIQPEIPILIPDSLLNTDTPSNCKTIVLNTPPAGTENPLSGKDSNWAPDALVNTDTPSNCKTDVLNTPPASTEDPLSRKHSNWVPDAILTIDTPSNCKTVVLNTPPAGTENLLSRKESNPGVSPFTIAPPCPSKEDKFAFELLKIRASIQKSKVEASKSTTPRCIQLLKQRTSEIETQPASKEFDLLRMSHPVYSEGSIEPKFTNKVKLVNDEDGRQNPTQQPNHVKASSFNQRKPAQLSFQSRTHSNIPSGFNAEILLRKPKTETKSKEKSGYGWKEAREERMNKMLEEYAAKMKIKYSK